MNDTSLWATDNEDPPERSSTPLYPSVAQRISEWTSLTSEQSRLKFVFDLFFTLASDISISRYFVFLD